ncbi:MAG TPA: hypothetical protein VF272_00945 [Candidatus Saccharimonadia bacterium]
MNSIIKIIDRFDIELNAEEMKKQGVEFGKQTVILPYSYSIGTSWYLGEHLKKAASLGVKITIIDPKGEKHPGPIQKNTLPSGIDRMNINFNVQGLPVSRHGNYTLLAEVVSEEDKVIGKGEYPFTVELVGRKIIPDEK